MARQHNQSNATHADYRWWSIQYKGGEGQIKRRQTVQDRRGGNYRAICMVVTNAIISCERGKVVNKYL